MSDELKRLSAAIQKAFAPGGPLAAIQDDMERERLIDELPQDQKAMANGLVRHANLCRFFSEHDMEVPPHIIRAVGRLQQLPIEERISQIDEINQELMEYLHNVSEDTGFRM